MHSVVDMGRRVPLDETSSGGVVRGALDPTCQGRSPRAARRAGTFDGPSPTPPTAAQTAAASGQLRQRSLGDRYSYRVAEDSRADFDTTPLSRWSRWCIGIGGLALTATGTAAVFVKDASVAGVPLLIVAGTGFLYVALTGQPLLQVNKDGVIFGRARRLERTLEQVTNDPTIPPEAKERIVDAAEANGIRLTASLSSADLEDAVRDLFSSIGEDYGFDVRRPVGPDRAEDFILLDREGHKVAVEVKGRTHVRAFAEAIRKLRGSTAPDRILVVDGSFPRELATEFQRDRIWIVGWGANTKEDLISLLRRINFIRS